MKHRNLRPSDSLDMLLDTMCNTFGGIILLAVLVTLLTSHERNGVGGNIFEPVEMLQRRIALALTNLNAAISLQTAMESDAKASIQKMDLVRERGNLQEELQIAREMADENQKDLNAVSGTDPSERMGVLKIRLAETQLRTTEAINALEAARDNLNRLKTRSAGLEKQITDLDNNSQGQFRLPKEHETVKHPFYVLIRYGKLYFWRNNDRSLNETDISWTFTHNLVLAEPKPGRGLDPTKPSHLDRIEKNFSTLANNSKYIVFKVWDDSFLAFIISKKHILKNNMSYGWEPCRIIDGPIAFTSDGGYTTKPQ